MALTQQEFELKALAIDRIRKHALPAQVPESIWAGQGSGEACSLCDRIIDKTEMEYELDAPMNQIVIRFHLKCLALWQLEIARLHDVAHHD